MQATPQRDTGPERELRSALHRLGLRFRVDRQPVPGLRRKADIVFGPARVAVFVDGCFWHGCPEHMTWPTANREWWEAKIYRTRERDHDTDLQLRTNGWRVVRVWEHTPTEEAVELVLTALGPQEAIHGRTRRKK
jgi:DNA mismatch endonuclease (patch repair protein)